MLTSTIRSATNSAFSAWTIASIYYLPCTPNVHRTPPRQLFPVDTKSRRGYSRLSDSFLWRTGPRTSHVLAAVISHYPELPTGQYWDMLSVCQLNIQLVHVTLPSHSILPPGMPVKSRNTGYIPSRVSRKKELPVTIPRDIQFILPGYQVSNLESINFIIIFRRSSTRFMVVGTHGYTFRSSTTGCIIIWIASRLPSLSVFPQILPASHTPAGDHQLASLFSFKEVFKRVSSPSFLAHSLFLQYHHRHVSSFPGVSLKFQTSTGLYSPGSIPAPSPFEWRRT